MRIKENKVIIGLNQKEQIVGRVQQVDLIKQTPIAVDKSQLLTQLRHHHQIRIRIKHELVAVDFEGRDKAALALLDYIQHALIAQRKILSISIIHASNRVGQVPRQLGLARVAHRLYILQLHVVNVERRVGATREAINARVVHRHRNYVRAQVGLSQHCQILVHTDLKTAALIRVAHNQQNQTLVAPQFEAAKVLVVADRLFDKLFIPRIQLEYVQAAVDILVGHKVNTRLNAFDLNLHQLLVQVRHEVAQIALVKIVKQIIDPLQI